METQLHSIKFSEFVFLLVQQLVLVVYFSAHKWKQKIIWGILDQVTERPCNENYPN